MHGGGAQRSLLRLAQGISERGYDVDLVLARAEGPFLAEVPERVRIVDLGAKRVVSSLPALVRYLRRELPVVMLSAMDYVNIVALWSKYLTGGTLRVVVSERSTLSHAAQNSPTRRGRLMPKLIRRFYPWADEIIAVSKGAADDLAKVLDVPSERIQVIYNPIVTPDLRVKANARLDHDWFQSGQPPVVLATGRLEPVKDFPTLIRAFALVRKSRPARLLILGEGQERQKLEALVAQLGLERDIGLPGFVANPYAYMARASLFVLSSKWEGLPGVLIEALYCGAPLISTDCPSGPREILAGGKYGQLVPVGDDIALARAIEVSLADERKSAPSQSWQPFEMDTVVDKYIACLLGT